MRRLGYGVYLLAAFLALVPERAHGQGKALPTVKADLPPPPSFSQNNAPEQYPDGTMSVYGVRRRMARYLDKDVQIKAVLLEVYECPPELRKCNDELQAKVKKEKKKELKGKDAAPGKGINEAKDEALKGGCRPCDQAHYFVADNMNIKKERSLLVADYPLKDWDTGKPKPLVIKPGESVVVTGTFAINSIGGFAASDGLIIHKKTQDSTGKVLAEGNAVLPPEAQDIKLEGRAAEKVGGIRIDANLPQGGEAQAGKGKPKGADKAPPREL